FVGLSPDWLSKNPNSQALLEEESGCLVLPAVDLFRLFECESVRQANERLFLLWIAQELYSDDLPVTLGFTVRIKHARQVHCWNLTTDATVPANDQGDVVLAGRSTARTRPIHAKANIRAVDENSGPSGSL